MVYFCSIAVVAWTLRKRTRNQADQQFGFRSADRRLRIAYIRLGLVAFAIIGYDERIVSTMPLLVGRTTRCRCCGILEDLKNVPRANSVDRVVA